jgi:hypothetical protein
MDKKTYASAYIVACTGMTGAGGRNLVQGSAYAPSAFLNIDEHIAAGHIVDKAAPDKKVAEAKPAPAKQADKVIESTKTNA